ncbi:MAG: hypothetical protein U9R56_05700, partial [candidate division Zixibacteria bacterium]|nr:hypothetical protein [candidate division Zixibacteria bacterium]
HIHNVRIGTRALVHDPFAYVDCIPTTYSRKIFVVLHIVRPEEVSSALREVVIAYQNHAFFVQIPLLRGINNDPQVMSDLWHKCSLNGLSPYYVFQCRPAIGNERFALTLREGHEVFSGAQACTTGVVKTPRYVMSNRTGKWEILGLDHDEIVLRCHQGTHPEMVGAIRHASPHAVWWDLRHDDPLIDATPMHRRTISGEE